MSNFDQNHLFCTLLILIELAKQTLCGIFISFVNICLLITLDLFLNEEHIHISMSANHEKPNIQDQQLNQVGEILNLEFALLSGIILVGEAVIHMSPLMTKSIKALLALYDTPPLCLFLLLHMFWHKNINVTTRFDQIHHLLYKILSTNIILKSIKGHNSVEKFGKIVCISNNIDHIHVYQCINKILSKSIHYF